MILTLTLNPLRFAELDTCYVITVATNNATDDTNDLVNPTNASLLMPMICPTKMRVAFIIIYFMIGNILYFVFLICILYFHKTFKNDINLQIPRLAMRKLYKSNIRRKLPLFSLISWKTWSSIWLIWYYHFQMSITYARDYILIANFLGMALIPFAILAVLNFRLYRTIKVFVFLYLSLCIWDGPQTSSQYL